MASKYPSAEDIELPYPDETDPSAEYAYGWGVQHNRMWALLILSFVTNILLGAWCVSQVLRYKPIVSYVTLEGGYPVMVGNNEVTLGGVEYNPARLRGVVKDYIESRFSYNWQNLGRVNDALKYLSEEAAKAEAARLTESFIQSKVLVPQVVATLEMDYLNMKVSPSPGKPDVFQVKVSGTMSYNDTRSAPDPAHPRVTPVSFTLEITRVKPTETNRDGYLITKIPEDIL